MKEGGHGGQKRGVCNFSSNRSHLHAQDGSKELRGLNHTSVAKSPHDVVPAVTVVPAVVVPAAVVDAAVVVLPAEVDAAPAGQTPYTRASPSSLNSTSSATLNL